MDKVYLIWKDGGLHAICPTEDDATRMAVSLTGSGWLGYAEGDEEKVTVEERAVVRVPGGMEPYIVHVMRDGTVIDVRVSPYTARWVDPGDAPRTVLMRGERLGKGRQPTRLMVNTWARTPDEAIDAAQQCRHRYIDQGRWKEWPTDPTKTG